jgi:hypothetical protein
MRAVGDYGLKMTYCTYLFDLCGICEGEVVCTDTMKVMRMMLAGSPGALGGGDLLWAQVMRLFDTDSKGKWRWGLGGIDRVSLKQTARRASGGGVQGAGLVERLSRDAGRRALAPGRRSNDCATMNNHVT